MTYAEKFSRLATRLKDGEWRQYGMLLLTGKALGHRRAVRDHCRRNRVDSRSCRARRCSRSRRPIRTRPRSAGDIINPINTGWVLLGAFLVFGMQAGFTMLEAGFCRNRETVNVLVECMFDTCVCGLLHWGWGFAFMFGAGNAFVGWHDPNDPTKSLHLHEGRRRH